MKRSLEDQINEFIEYWNCDKQVAFLRDIIPLFELYDVDDEDDWVEKEVGKDDRDNVRLIRTVYLVSRIAEFHASKLLMVQTRFKDLWKKIEKQGEIDGL